MNVTTVDPSTGEPLATHDETIAEELGGGAHQGIL